MQIMSPVPNARNLFRGAAQSKAAAIAFAFGVALLEPAAAAAAGTKRHFVVAAVEPKGGANVSEESFPAANRVAGEGYQIKEPGADGRWEVSAYVWMPAQIIVNQNDGVTIDFVGINGHAHSVAITGYTDSFVLPRGTTRRITFIADKAGVFPIDCVTHSASMHSEFVVQPNR